MQRVKITGAFFTPVNTLLKAGEHLVPDDWTLPKSAEVLEEEVEENAPAKPAKGKAAAG